MEQTPVAGGSTRTGLSIETVLAFDNNIQNGQEIGFIGASFEAGKTGSSVGANALATEDFFDAFIGKDKAGQENAHVYITGGQFSNASGELNDYSKEFSVHGKSIGLFTTSNRSTEKTTDANIQISMNNYQTQLGNTQFKLTREDDNLLETRGKLSVNLGASGNRKALDINANSNTIKLHTGVEDDSTYKPYYNQTINTSGINIDTTKSYNYISTDSNYKINLATNKLEMTNNNILFGSGNNSSYKNLITINKYDGT
jgi:hypothetical protein